MSELFDLDSGWKNSEVARIFIEASENKDDCAPEAFKATDVERNEDGSVEVELKPDPQPQVELELVKAELDTWQVQEALVRLAGQAAKNGNVKAAYLIERALIDISHPINKNET